MSSSKSKVLSIPPRGQPKRIFKAHTQVPLSSLSIQDDLENIVNNLSTIVKQSEQSLIATKSAYPTNAVRRTSSLHLTQRDQSILKVSHSNYEQSKEFSCTTTRRSMRNIEKFSGIKCSLPSSKTTVPKVGQSFEKPCTPTRSKPVHEEPNPTTPVANKGQVKSPWRLRFEKFLNHQDLTPLSIANPSIALPTANKENRTPSFRPPARCMSKIHTSTKSDH